MIPLRPLLSVLSPAGCRGQLSVFIFHRVLPHPDPILPSEVGAIEFDRTMKWVKAWFNVLPLDEAACRLKASTLPSRAAAITFDDGYADNIAVALPILKQHGLPATFFIATGFLDGGRMWNDAVIESIRACPFPLLDLGALGLGSYLIATSEQRRQTIGAIIQQIKYLPAPQRADLTEKLSTAAHVRLPDKLMMTSAQVKAMRQAGMQIGAHTVTHPILARVDAPNAMREIAGSKDFLEALLGERVSLFAYPNGKPDIDYSPEHPAMVKELGFDAAVSTCWGAANRHTDIFQIPRFTPWDRSQLRYGARLLHNLRRS